MKLYHNNTQFKAMLSIIYSFFCTNTKNHVFSLQEVFMLPKSYLKSLTKKIFKITAWHYKW